MDFQNRTPFSVAAVGCSLVDYLFPNASFSSPVFKRYASHSPGDGGLTPGHLVFAEDFARFHNGTLDEAMRAIVGSTIPAARNVGGPAIIALIHVAQSLARTHAQGNNKVNCYFYGARGRDEVGQWLAETGRAYVNMDNYREYDAPTPSTWVLSDFSAANGQGERLFINTLGAAAIPDGSELESDFFSADLCLFAATALMPTLHARLGGLVRRAQSAGALTVVGTVYDFWNESRNRTPWPLGEDNDAMKHTDVLLVDQEEALRISGASNEQEAMSSFLKRGVGAVLITHGAEPITIASSGRVFDFSGIRSYPIAALHTSLLDKAGKPLGDTTGCGDNFLGGITAGLARFLADGCERGRIPTDEVLAEGAIAGAVARGTLGGLFRESHPGQKADLLAIMRESYRINLPKRQKLRGTFVQLGAGAIGRSFVGRLFSEAGYEVVFSDINIALVDELNQRRGYSVVILENDKPNRTVQVTGVRAIQGSNPESVVEELANAEYAATAVGKNSLRMLAPVLAAGLVLRLSRYGKKPLDILLAENVPGVDKWLREEVSKYLPVGFPLADMAGFVGTAVGKMVPVAIAPADEPLLLYAEAFDTLYADAEAFLRPPTDIPGLVLKKPMKAWVDRKLYLHNLGHAAMAYLAAELDPQQLKFTWQAITVTTIRLKTEAAMRQAAAALLVEWPGVFTPQELENHIQDLLRRFANRSLGDTIHRVGRDLKRKLQKSDRLMGAILLAERHSLPWDSIGQAYLAALYFTALPSSEWSADDIAFRDQDLQLGIEHILRSVSNLDSENPIENAVMQKMESLSKLFIHS